MTAPAVRTGCRYCSTALRTLLVTAVWAGDAGDPELPGGALVRGGGRGSPHGGRGRAAGRLAQGAGPARGAQAQVGRGGGSW